MAYSLTSIDSTTETASRPTPLKLTVCLCTRNPRRDVLAIALGALADQTAPRNAFRVLIVDNGSEPALGAADMAPLIAAGVDHRIVVEPKLGIVNGRRRAIDDAGEGWILFVDDDNELAPDYIENGLKIIRSNPELGAFGGKLVLPDALKAKRWHKPFLSYIAVREFGEEPVTACTFQYGPWEAPTAGAFVRRDVLNVYRDRVASEAKVGELGRKQGQSLNSCEDALMMLGAPSIGAPTSYQPSLTLIHHIDEKRLRLGYLLRLLYAYGRSHVLLESLVDRTATPPGVAASGPAKRPRRLVSYAQRVGAILGWSVRNPAFAIGVMLESLGRIRAQTRRD